MASIHLLLALEFFPTSPANMRAMQGSQRDPWLAVEEEHWEEVMNRGGVEYPALHDGTWPVLALTDEQAIRRDVWRGLFALGYKKIFAQVHLLDDLEHRGCCWRPLEAAENGCDGCQPSPSGLADV
jgi:hypothetical protein